MKLGQTNAKLYSPGMPLIAALSFVALTGAIFWQIKQGLASGTEVSARNDATVPTERARTPFDAVNWQSPAFGENAEAAGDPSSSAKAMEDRDGLSNIGENVVGALFGSYATLAQSGAYAPEMGEAVAEDIAQSLRATVSYPTYSENEIKADPDTSNARVLDYRNEMRIALEPLLKNKQYELSNFALYIETRDKKYVNSLNLAAQNYRLAIENAANVVVPKDAVGKHVEILNALSEFGSILESMAEYGEDAFAAVALLRTYDEAEKRMFASFDALARYSWEKQS